ncbi:ATP-binding cassette domain-containing protein [Pseudonocardia broussonetiae]|uniref:ATP-binding cassette domain-containing protein n=1 Tax=Pseudonocardia broussonetiae TaxID=2736640 RepID=A0A6M6JLN5_9PSEU|nr:ATP-binding cassette domain-containing protein [Pseudonocardia broussonetiae]QJY49034.1 ATP-binding cassette domain-containing protein [Pseudonocardia broussonetiae]
MIEIRNLTRTYGPTTAVDDLSVTVRPGVVTGFLGPNGAGKSTTMRVTVGLTRPTSGEVVVNGHRYDRHAAPLHEVGALLDAHAVHPGRSARAHLRALAATHGIGPRRVDEVLDTVGLTDVAGQRAGGFSLGMGQRLGIAAALLGDPQVVLLDEPVNGLDPDGIRWIRALLRGLAAEGRTVFVSSHLMSEMALTADHLVILGQGRLLADMSLAELTASASGQVLVRSPQADELSRLLSADGVTITDTGTGGLSVTGRTAEEIARVALSFRILLTELTPVHASLEDAYHAMTQHDVRYRATSPGRAAA